MDSSSSSGNNIYRAYRKIRFLTRRGTFFSVPGRNDNRSLEIPAGTFRIILLNSLFFFLLAYLIVYSIYLLSTGIAALTIEIPIILYFDHVEFIIRGKDWTADAVNIVFSSGPLMMLILAVIFFIIYISVEMETGILRLLLLWMMFHAMTRGIGEVLVGTLMDKGFGYVIMYMFVMDTEKLLLTSSAFIMMFTIGIFITRPALYTANIYFNDLLKSYRNRFTLNQFLLPFLIGNIVILLVKLPSVNLFDIFVNATMILILLPLAARGSGMGELFFDDDTRKIKFSIFLPVVSILLYMLYRIILGYGIRVNL